VTHAAGCIGRLPGPNEDHALVLSVLTTAAFGHAGVTYAGKLSSELLPCAGAIGGGGFDPNTCPWFRSPEKPSSDGGGPMGLPAQASGVPKLTLLTGNCRIVGTTVSCDGLLDRP
jgi:hypothetical protein